MTRDSEPIRDAVVSSTALDLPAHRLAVEKACREARYFPHLMEDLPASERDAIASSMKLVNDADVYIGIFAFRYGHVPKGAKTSITEMEFEQAVRRRITILPFLMDSKHTLTEDMVERSKDAARKLERLKKRACQGRGRKMFESPADLAGKVVSALKELRLEQMQSRLFAAHQAIEGERGRADAALKELADVRSRLKHLLATRHGGTKDGPKPQ